MIGVQVPGRPHAHQPLVHRREEITTTSTIRPEKATTLTVNTVPMIWITAQARLGRRLSLTMTLIPILSPVLRQTEMEKTADSSTVSEMPLVVTIQSDQVQWALLGPLMVVAGVVAQTIGIWTPEPGITTRGGEEGVAVEIDHLTVAEEVVVEEPRNVHQGTRHTHNGAVPKITPARHLQSVSVIRMANNRATGVLWGNGVTAHL